MINLRLFFQDSCLLHEGFVLLHDCWNCWCYSIWRHLYTYDRNHFMNFDFLFVLAHVFILYCLHGVCFQVRNWLFSLIGLRNPKDESAQSRRKYDFNNEVLAWRMKLRKERYSTCMLNTIPDISSVVKLSIWNLLVTKAPLFSLKILKPCDCWWIICSLYSERYIVLPIQSPPGIDQPISYTSCRQ